MARRTQRRPSICALLLGALRAVRDEDFTARLPGDWTGLSGKIAGTFNEIVSANASLARELARVGEAVGKKGGARQHHYRPSAAWRVGRDGILSERP